MKTFKSLFIAAFVASMFYGCGSSAIISTPIESIDNTPIKTADLTEAQLHHWSHLDLVKDTVPGMSVDKLYSEIIKNKKGKKVIVAVVDSGIDIDHEDLRDVIWTNEGEIPNNGIDDDKNGYVDDVHGWNFLGDGYDEQLEYVRILASGDTSNPDYEKAKAEYDKEYQLWMGRKTLYDQIYAQITSADETLSNVLNKKEYTKEDIDAIKSTDPKVNEAIQIVEYYGKGTKYGPALVKSFKHSLESINDRLNINLNKNLKGRVTGDNPDDMSTKYYGNGNVRPVKKSESHGTHVAGIIAAERNNGIGVDGVANNVLIMPVRTVPNGDEYDKDVALAIRYAVDNGAKVINGSFGKYYSTHSDWVREAIAYAGEHDVLFVNAAGNEGKDLDKVAIYPNDQVDNGPEVSNNFITVGALAPKYGPDMVAGYSNYGKINVDLFAPGSEIYSTTPENDYESYNGTSMAAPAVAGVAALVRSYYPDLTAGQVKQVLMSSGLAAKTNVIVGGDADNVKPFADLSKSGKMVNAFNALIVASHMATK